MGAGADPCARFYFCCALLLFGNKGEETEPEHFMCSKNFLSPGMKNKTSFNSFQFYFSFASGHLCLWAWKL